MSDGTSQIMNPKTEWSELLSEHWDRWVRYCQLPFPWLLLALFGLVTSLHLYFNESNLGMAIVTILLVVFCMFQFERKMEAFEP